MKVWDEQQILSSTMSQFRIPPRYYCLWHQGICSGKSWITGRAIIVVSPLLLQGKYSNYNNTEHTHLLTLQYFPARWDGNTVFVVIIAALTCPLFRFHNCCAPGIYFSMTSCSASAIFCGGISLGTIFHLTDKQTPWWQRWPVKRYP